MIGVLSDTHDNLPAIKKAVKLFNDKKVDLVLHAGDFVSPFTVRVFKELKCPMKGVFGNNDGDPVTLKKFFKGIAEIKTGWLKIEHSGMIIYLTHIALPSPPADADIYIYGHSHDPIVDQTGCLIINPGECSGWLSNRQTVALIDIEKKIGKPTAKGKIVEI